MLKKSWVLNGIKMRVFFEKNIEKKHMCRHYKNLFPLQVLEYDQSFKKYGFVENKTNGE